MGLKDIMTKPRYLGSTELAWKEPLFYPIRLRRDALWRLLIAIGVATVVAGILLGVFSLNEEPPDWNFAVALGLLAFFFALFFVFGRRGHVSGRIILHRDTIRRTTVSCGAPSFLVMSEERWEYDQISNCVFIPAKDVGRGFSIMLVSYGGSQDLIGIPRRIDLRQVAGILLKHGVRVQRGSRLPQHTTQGLSFLAPTVTVAGGLLTLVVGLVLYSAQTPPQEKSMLQRPPIPGLDDMRGAPSPAFPPPTDPASTATPPLPEGRPNRELDDMRQIRDGMRPTPDAMRQRPGGMRSMTDGMRDRPPSLPSPDRPPGFAAPDIPGSDSTKDDNYVLTETAGSADGSAFRKVDYRGRPVIGVRFTLRTREGTEYVGRLTPLFRRTRSTPPNTIFAKDGYALGAIHVWTGEFVEGIKLEFMKLNDDTSLQLSDSYEADTIGSATTGTARIITSDGKIVVGLHGRRSAMMDAIGLVVRK